MWPWGHLALGYLLYSVGHRISGRGAPHEWPVVWLAIGTQFPDLVDKPLAWYLHVLPSGRTLAHSSLTATLVMGSLWVALSGRRHLVVGFAAGYLSHLLGDAIRPLLAGDIDSLYFLLWPILPPVQYDSGTSIWGHLATVDLTSVAGTEIGMLVLVMGLWVIDGAPGIGILRGLLGGRRRGETR